LFPRGEALLHPFEFGRVLRATRLGVRFQNVGEERSE
jgi:hypothetical protein